MPTQDTPGLGFDYVEANQSGKEVVVNANADIADLAALTLPKVIANGSNVLTLAESRSAVLYLTGLLSAGATVTVDASIGREIRVFNATTGGQTVQVRFGAGTLRTVPTDGAISIWPSGWRNLNPTPSVTLAGDVSGPSGSTVVDSFKGGIDFPALTAPDDGLYLRYDHGTGAIVADDPGSGGISGVDIQDGGAGVGTGFTTLNIIGAASVTDAGGGVADIDVTSGGGGGGSGSGSFGNFFNGSPVI